MTIFLHKFGTLLSSRQAGKEAYSAFLPTLNTIKPNEDVIADFSGVGVFTPSWGDEFLTPILEKFGPRFSLINTENPSVKMTLETLEEVHHIIFHQKETTLST